jgi:hypothetical protein
MTDEILGYIYEYLKCENLEEKNQLISSLRDDARKLSMSYNSGPDVKCEYESASTQIAYLLRYYLPYSQTVNEVFKEIKKKGTCEDYLQKIKSLSKLKLAILGAGPAPELFGLVKLIIRQKWSTKTIHAHLCDKNSWSITRELVKEKILPSITKNTNLKIQIQNWQMQFDSDTDNDLKKWEFLSDCKLIWLQNCFNENTDKSITSLLRNIAFHIKPEALIILLDSLRTTNDTFRFRKICNILNTTDNNESIGFNFKTIVSNTLDIENLNLYQQISPDIKNKLFYVGEPITSENSYLNLKKTFKYNLCILQKS